MLPTHTSPRALFFDELIVGAGLTGLVYGNVAAQAGRRVAIIEKHTKPGGYATNFSRKEAYVFDCSLHKITGFGTQGNLEDALKRADLWKHLSFYPYEELTHFIIGDRHLSLPCHPDKIEPAFHAHFPHEAEGLTRFFADIRRCGHQNYMLARASLGEYEMDGEIFVDSRKLSRITAYQYFLSLFSDTTLISLLCALAINLGVEAVEVDALYFMHFAYTFFLTEKRYVKGSSQSLSDALAAEFVKRGGSLFLGERLQSIETNPNNELTGAKTKRHHFKSAHMIFTGCPHLLPELVPHITMPEAFTEKLDRLQFGLGSFMVYLGLSVPPTELGFIESDYLIADERYLIDADQACHTELRYDRWPLSISNYYALDPNYGWMLQLGTLDQEDDWLTLPRDQYKAKKQRIMEHLIERACRYFPALKNHIVYTDASTPRTNKKYTNSGGGSSFGYKPLPKRNTSFLHQPPVKGIQFVGTWINGAGYEPAMCLGFTSAILRQRTSSSPSSQHSNARSL